MPEIPEYYPQFLEWLKQNEYWEKKGCRLYALYEAFIAGWEARVTRS